MKRFHVHAHVEDLQKCIAFYTQLYGQTSCCYAQSDKYWLTDPQGIAWEHFHTLGSIPAFSEAKTTAGTESACCAPQSPRGKPVGIPVKAQSGSNCC